MPQGQSLNGLQPMNLIDWLLADDAPTAAV